MTNSTISKNLKKLRADKGYSIRHLAEIAGINEKQIRRFETPDYNFSLTSKSLSKLMAALGCSIEDIMTNKEKTIGTLYFVSLIHKSDNIEKISLYDGYTSYDEALSMLLKTVYNYNTITAWIDEYTNGSKRTVFHKCYI